MPAKKVESGIKNSESRKKIGSLSVPVFLITGVESGSLSLPGEYFGAKINNALLTHALRVYNANSKTLTGSTKTRGEVSGSTVKIFSQKGTGRARHGSVRAPIFVGGGIVFGPKPRKVTLDLPKKMKKAALISALSVKVLENKTFGLSGLEKATGKTKEIIKLLSAVNSQLSGEKNKENKSALIVTGEKIEKLLNATKNISNVRVLPINLINVFEVIKHETLLLTKEALEKLESRIKNDELSIEDKSEEKKDTSKKVKAKTVKEKAK